MPPGDEQHACVAVVGIAGRFPGAASVSEFWRRLRAGQDALYRVPPEELAAAGMASLAEAFRTKYAVPGLSVAIAHQGQLVYDEAFGMADVEHEERATPSHRFRIASLSKPITACAIMDLVESGRLRLEDRVFGRGGVLATDYGRTPYGRNIENITIEHLLTHTSGGWPKDATDPTFRNVTLNRTELISWTLDNMPLTSVPGQAYAYSNFGFMVLGRVIEVVTGNFYEAHIQRRILGRWM